MQPWEDESAQHVISQYHGESELAFSDNDSIDPDEALSIDSGGWEFSDGEDVGAGTREVDHDTIHGTRLDSVEKQIRLVDILPRDGVEHDIVCCRIFKAYLPPDSPGPDVQRYNALSYVWGDTFPTADIVLNGSKMAVTRNLESALRHLRDSPIPEAQSLPIWVDAICINQDDLRERNEQVRMMRDVYRKAHRVVSYLGDGDFDTDWALEKFRQDDFWLNLQRASDLGSSSDHRTEIIRASVIMARDLAERVYWSRVWIIQEVMLATQDPVLVCGSQTLVWSEYIFYADTLYQWAKPNITTQEHMDALANLYVFAHPHLPFLPRQDKQAQTGATEEYWSRTRRAVKEKGHAPFSYLFYNRFLEKDASCKSDFVYGLHGLLPQKERDMIDIDYSRPPMDVFHDAMVVCWTSAESAEYLPFAVRAMSFHKESNTMDETEAGLPSWVPDLSRQRDKLERRMIPSPRPAWRTSNISLSSDKRVLNLRGISLDTVSRTSSVLFDSVSDLGCFTPNLNDLRHAVSQATTALCTGIPAYGPLCHLGDLKRSIDTRETVFRTLAHVDDLPLSGQHFWFWQELWDCLLEPNTMPATVAAMTELAEKNCRSLFGISADNCVRAMFLRIEWRLNEHKLFETEGGFIGVGPSHLASHDQIVFPLGMACPFALRPCVPACDDDSRQQFTMIGCVENAELNDHESLDCLVDQGVFQVIDFDIR